MFRSLLIPIDLMPGSERIASRAALLPLAGKARLTLLHVVTKRLSARARQRARDDARRALQRLAGSLERTLPDGAAVQTVVKTGAPAAEIAKQAKAGKAELIVMGRGSGRPLRDVFLGSTAERVIRQGQMPVLVVRLPAHAPYRRPAVALDLEDGAEEVLSLLLRVIPAPRPRVSVIHAFDAPFQGLIYPSLTADEGEEYRAHHREKARKALARLLSASVPPGETPAWRTHVVEGPPRTVIERTVKKTNADLLVLGTHCYSGVAHAFLGTVAGDVLRGVPCDVLVTPPRPGANGAAA